MEKDTTTTIPLPPPRRWVFQRRTWCHHHDCYDGITPPPPEVKLFRPLRFSPHIILKIMGHPITQHAKQLSSIRHTILAMTERMTLF
eukprot:scaffold93029_cov53-Attheya_sp.AAC.3